MSKILHLHVKEKYWWLTNLGVKEWEYRRIRPYWIKRLKNKTYDLIYYYLGYTKKKLIFKFDIIKKLKIQHPEFGKSVVDVFAISLKKRVSKCHLRIN